VPAPDVARRLDRWKLSLLDLTLRNRLLDARDGRQVVPLVGADPVALMARLDDGAQLRAGARRDDRSDAVGGPERAAEAMAKAGADALERKNRLLAARRRRRARSPAGGDGAQRPREPAGERGLDAVARARRPALVRDRRRPVARHAPLALYPGRAAPRRRRRALSRGRARRRGAAVERHAVREAVGRVRDRGARAPTAIATSSTWRRRWAR
jgi:hypothetical protein